MLIADTDDQQFKLLLDLRRVDRSDVKTTRLESSPRGLEGVVTYVPIYTSDDYIASELEKDDASHAQRITKKVGGNVVQTPPVKLVFEYGSPHVMLV